MRHRFVHRAGTLALTLLMVALSTLMVGASGDRAKAEKASSLPEKEAVKTGVTIYSNAKASIDASNLSEGYLIVKYTGGKSVRIKVQITKSGGTTYTYDLNNTGTVETFPLTEGDGTYTVRPRGKGGKPQSRSAAPAGRQPSPGARFAPHSAPVHKPKNNQQKENTSWKTSKKKK